MFVRFELCLCFLDSLFSAVFSYLSLALVVVILSLLLILLLCCAVFVLFRRFCGLLFLLQFASFGFVFGFAVLVAVRVIRLRQVSIDEIPT